MTPARLPQRFLAKFIADSVTGCWNWQGTILNKGYGQYYVGGGQKHRVQVLAHRFAYEYLVGPIPPELTLDHLCRNRRCVNPAHLEPVSRGENVLRGDGLSARNARKTHCSRGHQLTEANVYRSPSRPSQRMCRVCLRERNAEGYVSRYAYHAAYRHSDRGKEVQRQYRARKKAQAPHV